MANSVIQWQTIYRFRTSESISGHQICQKDKIYRYIWDMIIAVAVVKARIMMVTAIGK
jgi:hypothetical protein